MSNSYTKIKQLEVGTNLYFNASLFLLENGDYVMDYQEVSGSVGSDGFMTVTPVFQKRLKGKWAIDKTALKIEGVGTGAGFTINKDEVLAFKIEQKINAPEATEKLDYFYYTASSSGMPDKFGK